MPPGRAHARALVATGGDTASASSRRTRQSGRCRFSGDLMPGISDARIRVDVRSLWLVTKPGDSAGATRFARSRACCVPKLPHNDQKTTG